LYIRYCGKWLQVDTRHIDCKIFLFEKLPKKLVKVKNVGIPLHVQKTRGAIKQRAEIIPKEPDAGNAAEGKASCHFWQG
jgi:hypothetical protein